MATSRRPPQRVLIADPDAAVRRGLARALLAAGLDVVTAEDARAAEALVASSGARVLVAASGIAAAFEPRRAAGVSPVLVVLAEPEGIAQEASAYAGRALAVLARGPDVPGLALVASGALELAGARAEERGSAAAAQAEEPVAAAASMRRVMRSLRDAASRDVSVMMVGATGTGRRTLARWLHAASGRRGALVSIAAADLDAAALDDALARARQGTLVFDGLEAAGPVACRALAEALTGGTRGGPDTAPRLVAVATPELRARRERGDFPSAAFFALAGVVVDVPGLAARADDVPVLARIFARRAAERLGVPLPSFHTEALRALRRAPWPDQLPELEGRVARAVALGRSPISAGDLGLAPERDAPRPHVDLPYAQARARALGEFERAYVGAALGRAGGNVARAAVASGMDRANFRRLLKRIAAEERAALHAEATRGEGREGAEP